jgi:hypothetical protein
MDWETYVGCCCVVSDDVRKHLLRVPVEQRCQVCRQQVRQWGSTRGWTRLLTCDEVKLDKDKLSLLGISLLIRPPVYPARDGSRRCQSSR